MKTYKTILEQSAKLVGNCCCMGLDPQWEVLPNKTDFKKDDLVAFFSELFEHMVKEGVSPAAFKPNIGYYVVLDEPRKGLFEGSLALNSIIQMIETLFPEIPIILDAKRGDIARSSENYAHEAFNGWKCDAVTVSPYMGRDSVSPFSEKSQGEKGIYILNRTSNPGAKDLQGLTVVDDVDEKELYQLYTAVAHRIAQWAEGEEGIGAVVGATNQEELHHIASYFGQRSIPLLIPGVGSQGASAQQTMTLLRDAGYPVELARINSSSQLTHPWKTAPAPKDYLLQCMNNIIQLCKETSL